MPHDDNEYQTFNHGAPAGYTPGNHQTPSIQVHNKGGRVVVQHGMPDATATPIPAPEMCRVRTGPIRYTGSSEVTSVGNVQYAHSDTGTAGGSVMGTLRTTGRDASVELSPGNPATRTILATAEREGLIRRSASGGWEDVMAAASQPVQPVQQQAPEQPQTDPGAHSFSAEDDAGWAADIEPLPQHAYDGAIASVVGVVAHGMGSLEGTAKSLAASAGISPELARDYVDQGYAMYERTVSRALAPMGLEGDRLQHFYDAIRSQPAKLQDAIQRLVHGRDPGGFKDLAVAYKVANPGNLSAFKAAGFETMTDRSTGDVMLRRPGGNWVRAADLK